ncbi:hypothetical protein HHI36_014421 [Cryptolaemus montrouzieri]|uniref:Uncharacterized protein n=1 Tax=Cryptolaemus montrouzieri TaxID=559131 RepID=A0ABD2N2T0_9CUCU
MNTKVVSLFGLLKDKSVVVESDKVRTLGCSQGLESIDSDDTLSSDDDEPVSPSQGVLTSTPKARTVQLLFNRLKVPPSEAQQIKFYQTQLALVDIQTYSDLKHLCRQLEHRREAVEVFQPPTRKQQAAVLEPDLDYVGVEYLAEVHALENYHQNDSPSLRNNFTSLYYISLKPGHRATGCFEPKRKMCDRCRKPDGTVRTCTNCSRPSRNGPRH